MRELPCWKEWFPTFFSGVPTVSNTSKTQRACGPRVGVRETGIRIAWALLPFARCDLSRPWDSTVHATDASLTGMGVTALNAPDTVVKSAGSISERWRFKGPMRTASKPPSALDEEVGPSHRDLLDLTDYQALCLGTRTVFPEIPVTLYAADGWRVLCARLSKRPERMRPLCGHSERFAEKSQSRQRKHLILSDSVSWVCASTKGRSSIWSVARRARGLRGLCLASDATVCYRWFLSERSPADEPSRRFEWSSPVKLQAQDCPDNVHL